MKRALAIVDQFTHMTFLYLVKDKSQYVIAAALEEHFLQQWSMSTEIKSINFFINRTVMRSDEGTDVINSSVHDSCERLDYNVEYSCPGQLGKYQNCGSLVERRIKEIGRMANPIGNPISVRLELFVKDIFKLGEPESRQFVEASIHEWNWQLKEIWRV